MKVGIIFHSYTGNTMSVAEKLGEKFKNMGHDVLLEKIDVINENPNDALNVELGSVPDTSDFDLVIFGAPVRGMSISPVIKKYLEQIDTLKDKKVSCFVTQFFPFEWMGGKHAVSQMKKICELKNGEIYSDGIVNWSNSKRDKKIELVVDKITKI